ncbi:zinc-ribbon domain-containing protein [Bacillus albus]|uniref:zinc-ribbon domain-containing protein n=1 Tax=Bacillus albus TaxID=2026189 RepID=UPI001021A704|nr:zinc-ribbon domain-containing protein [Bacillus albus]
MVNKVTLEDMQQLAESRGGKCLSDRYINSQTNMTFQCKNGHVWDAKPAKIRFGQWCRKCSGREKKTLYDMQEIAKQHDGECLSAIYENSQTKLLWQCKHGHKFEATAASIFYKAKKGNFCPKCSAKQRGIVLRHTIEDMQQLAYNRGGKCLSTIYTDSHTKLIWKCADGHTWEAKPNQIISGKHWCPHCTPNLTEERIRFTLETLTGLSFKSNREAIAPYELDGYNESLHIGFEYNGIQHYEMDGFFIKNEDELIQNIQRDTQKEQLCKQRGIKLLIIPTHDISDKTEDKKIIQYITNMLKTHNIPIKQTIHFIDSRKLYTQYMSSLYELNEIAKTYGGQCTASEYKGSKTKIEFVCAKGHYFLKRPYEVKQGQWCKECYLASRNDGSYRNDKKVQSLYDLNKIAETHDGKCISLKYKDRNTKLEFVCAKGHHFMKRPYEVMQGQWCRECYLELRKTNPHSYEKQQKELHMLDKIAQTHSGRCISKEYKNRNTKLEFVCSAGHHFMKRPYEVMRGQWCKQCYLDSIKSK